MISKSFLDFKAIMAKWHSQALFESVTDKKRRTFSPPGGARYPSSTKLGMVIEEVRTLLAPRKYVRLRRIVSPLGGAENLG